MHKALQHLALAVSVGPTCLAFVSLIRHSCPLWQQEEDRGKHRKKRNRFIDDIAAVDEEDEEEEDEVQFSLLSLSYCMQWHCDQFQLSPSG